MPSKFGDMYFVPVRVEHDLRRRHVADTHRNVHPEAESPDSSLERRRGHRRIELVDILAAESSLPIPFSFSDIPMERGRIVPARLRKPGGHRMYTRCSRKRYSATEKLIPRSNRTSWNEGKLRSGAKES